jgi:hypothetical protein
MKQMKLAFFPKVLHGKLLIESLGRNVRFVRFIRKRTPYHTRFFSKTMNITRPLPERMGAKTQDAISEDFNEPKSTNRGSAYL